MERFLDDEIETLLAETNDQRRRAGQTLWHFYRSLVFWRDRGRTFHEVVRAWSPAGAAIFDGQAASLRRLLPHQADVRLRTWLAGVLGQLADDLERGDHMVVPFLRWIEGKFPELTAMMKAETPDSRIHDLELAVTLARMFGLMARADRAEAVRVLRDAVADLPARTGG